MGSDDGQDDEKPLRKQKMAAFFMDRTEVTVDAFAACVRAGDCRPPTTVSAGCGRLMASQPTLR